MTWRIEDWKGEEADCEKVAAELGRSIEWVRVRWDKFSDGMFASWLIGLADMSGEQFMALMEREGIDVSDSETLPADTEWLDR